MILAKKAIVWVVAFVLIFTPLFIPSVRAEEAEEYVSGDYSYTVSKEGAVITRYTGEASDLTVPDSLDGHKVIGIGASAFYLCGNLTAINLPEGLTSIGDHAFICCSNLTAINLPDSLTSMGINPFSNTPVSISLSPDQPRFALIDGVLFDKVEKKLVAYPYASKAEKYSVPQGVRIIGNQAFSGCRNLTAINLPEGLTSIGDYTFSECDNLAAINLPNGLTSIGDTTFYDCGSLASITIPDSLTSMGENPFVYTPVSITLSPDQPRFALIDGVLFDKVEKKLVTYPLASKAEEYAVPQGIRIIGDSAFTNCVMLTAINLPEGLTSIGDNAFSYCDNLTTINLPEGLTSIGESTFCSCDKLTVINLPDSLTSMGDNPFRYTSLSITLSPDQPRYALIDGVLFDKVEKKLVAYPFASKAEVYDVPLGIRSIGDFSFALCCNLTAITLPEGLTSIGDEAFASCYNLTTINLPEGLTSIGDTAFDECPNLTLTVTRNSYAARWAKEHGIPYTYTDALDWLTDGTSTD